MLAMDGRVAELCKQDIARDDDLLSDAGPSGQAEAETPLSLMHHTVANERVILTMVKNGQAEHPGIFNRATHDLVILHTVSVIRDRDNSGSQSSTHMAPIPLRRGPS